MATIVKLVQGSAEWHEHRRSHRNASETPVVLGLSPFLTPYQLFLAKTGRELPQVTWPMIHGTELEPRAREAYEQLTGQVIEPVVMVEGDYSCSLDGLTFDQRLLVEIKCPYKGQASELWQAVEAGEVPEHYRWQLQHQLMVAQAELAHLYVFDGEDGLLLEAKPRPGDWPRIHEGWEWFQRFVRDDQAPPLTERDTLARQDPEWQASAEAYIALKRSADEAVQKLEAAKQRLISLASHARVEGAGVSVTRFWKAGNVDYKRVPQLEGVDLESYRGQGREEVRITILK
jgi:putative phage-type endonuclease